MFDDQPTVLLVGPGAATEVATWPDSDSCHKIKVPRGNCHDHFTATTEHVDRDGLRLRVFRWTDRTYVAE